MGPLAKYLETLQATLAPVSQECALYEAEQILQHILKCSRSDLYLKGSQLLNDDENVRLQAIIEKRLSGEPLAYILGSVFFYSMDILVNRDVMIPRPETEILVDTILKNESSEQCAFIDVGTGSGAIAAVLCKERALWGGIGIDNSPAALVTARQNCNSDKIKLVCSDLFTSIKKTGYDFIVSNPPYVSEDEMKELDPSVSRYEPHKALWGGKDGMDFYRYLSAEGKKVLKPGGRIYCEIGYSQGEKSGIIFSEASWSNIKILNDLTSRPRVVMATCDNF